MEYEDVDYWEEICQIFEWTKSHVTSTLHLCWGAQAGMYYHYGLKKYLLPQKKFGVYEHRVMNRKVPLVRGFDDCFMAPHSRHTEVRTEDIRKVKELTILGIRSMTATRWIKNTSGTRRRGFPLSRRSTIIRTMTIRKSRTCSGARTAISFTATG